MTKRIFILFALLFTFALTQCRMVRESRAIDACNTVPEGPDRCRCLDLLLAPSEEAGKDHRGSCWRGLVPNPEGGPK